MSFLKLNSVVGDFRNSLWRSLGCEVIGNITVRAPEKEHDEVSFLRLTTWCYGVIVEEGRVVFPFILKAREVLASQAIAETHWRTKNGVNRLRTWFFHNLNFQREADLETSRLVAAWFKDRCGATFPVTNKHWRKAFQAQAEEVISLVRFCDELLSGEICEDHDLKFLLDDLRLRLQREIPVYEFDRLITDASLRLGEDLDVPAFRKRHIDGWRKSISVFSDSSDWKSEVERMVDSTVFNFLSHRLPLSTREVMEYLDLKPGREVGEAIRLALNIWQEKKIKGEELLLELEREWEKR